MIRQRFQRSFAVRAGLALLCGSLGLLGNLLAADERADAAQKKGANQKILVTTGIGIDDDAARKNALARAVEEAVGVVVDAQTTVKDEQLISDKILTYSDAFVSHVEVIRTWKEAELTNVKIQATVEMRPLIQKLEANNIAVKDVSGESLFATAVTQEKRKADGQTLILEQLKDFPVNVMQAEIAGEPQIVKTDGDDATVRYDLRLSVDRQKYKEFVERLKRTLDGTNQTGISINLVAEDLVAEDNRYFASHKAAEIKLPSPSSQIPAPDGKSSYLLLNLRSDTADRRTQWSYYPINPEIAKVLFLLSLNSLEITVDYVDESGGSLLVDQVGTYVAYPPGSGRFIMAVPISQHFGRTKDGRFRAPGPSGQDGQIGMLSPWLGYTDGMFFISPYFTWDRDEMNPYTSAVIISRELEVNTADLKKIKKATARISSRIPLPPKQNDYKEIAAEYKLNTTNYEH